MSRSHPARTQEPSVSQLNESSLDDSQLERLKQLMDTDHPLEAGSASTKLQASAAEWNNNVAKGLARAITLMTEAAEEAALASAEGENDEDQETLNAVDAEIRALIDSMFEAKQQAKSIGFVRQLVLAEEDGVENPSRLIEGRVTTEMEKYNAQTARQKYGESTEYKDFKEKIWDAQHAGEQMGSINRFLPAEGDESDDEIEMGATARTFKDPLTMLVIKNPVKSPECKHVFDRDSIAEYFKGLDNKAKEPESTVSYPPYPCPVSGCSAMFTPATLKEDSRTAELIRRMQQAEQKEKEARAATQRKRQVMIGSEDEDEEDEVPESEAALKQAKVEK